MEKPLILFGILFAFGAQADQPTSEMQTVTAAMINSPAVMTQLEDRGTSTLIDYKITDDNAAGTNTVELSFLRVCECNDSLTAKVKIVQNYRGMQDGPGEYTSTVKFESVKIR